MKISESWLREWVDPDLDTEALAHRLTMLGLEVDGVEPVAEAVDAVVVGEVLEVSAHPNANRLSVCRVDVGDGEPLSIVCGAANVRAGVRYPTALVGARFERQGKRVEFPGGKFDPRFLRGCDGGLDDRAVQIVLGGETSGDTVVPESVGHARPKIVPEGL